MAKEALVLPISFAQQRLWFLDQWEPGNTAYNDPLAIRLTGLLNLSALERSLNEMVRRHETLRTTFATVDGQPVQVVSPVSAFDIPSVDLRDLTKEEREAGAQNLVNEEARRPFDLARGPLFRTTLLCLEEEEYILLLTMHHIVSDGWSRAVLFRELGALYEAFSSGKSSPLPELPIQYADFAQWQREWLQGEVLESQLAYWKGQLEGCVPVSELPTDRPRPAVQTYQGAKQSVVLSQGLTEGLKSLSRKEGVTLFMTLLAAFQVLLHRYSGQEDIVVGSPIAGRRRSEIEGLIGFFVNTLVLRTDISGKPTFRELLGRVREVALGAYDHQDLPFEKLMEELHPERNLSHSPLFQVMFVLQNTPTQVLELPGIILSSLEVESRTAKFDLTLSLTETELGLQGHLEYNTDLFDTRTIQRMVGHFQTLTEGIVADPDQRVWELPLLTEAERHQLLVEWNDTRVDYPRDLCIHELFEAQVERTPEAIALVFEEEQLTYRELNRRANQLAHHLRSMGVGPEVLVGICMERSLEMIVGLLGILKAGGAYVPLDPTYPKERLAYVLEDTQIQVVLTQEFLLDVLPGGQELVLCLDTGWEAVARESEENPLSGSNSENLAYVIYTSGSTGTPKGVGVEHAQLVNYTMAILGRLGLGFGDSFAMVQPLAADSCITAIFPSLVVGASLHVISQERAANPQALSDYFHYRPIDYLKITPSHLKALQASNQPQTVMPRRCLVLGGEGSRWEWVRYLKSLAPECVIFNHYGPTETTVGVLTYRIEEEQFCKEYSTTPLGRPISNTHVYILDSALQCVPVGVAGELYISGANLARGYLNNPELTSERFISNPYGTEPDTRLYKTGDLARYLPDGNIEFLGRGDDQVKIRGFRIEIGEVEAVLGQHPDLRDVSVVAREDSDGDINLVAYVVPCQDGSPAEDGHRRYRLPNNMVVAHLNKNETDYMYREIFELQAYLRHGITVNDGDTIFDVGANIGLFTLFVSQICENPKIYSFEPNQKVFELLKLNAALCGPDVKLFECGLSDQKKTESFTFFLGFSLLSGFYADAEAEKELVKAFMANRQKRGEDEVGDLIEQADDFLEERFSPKTFPAELRTFSSVIEQEKLESIDLLKINVEKSELDVLSGFGRDHWKKIKQIVLEVDSREILEPILSLLELHGYEYVVEQDVLLETTELRYVYAIRPSTEGKLVRWQEEGAHIRSISPVKDDGLSIDELKRFLSLKLPDYMVPSTFVVLDALPLTPNGKVDRNKLPASDRVKPQLEQAFAAARSPVEEKLAGIWADVLGLDRVSIYDNFFDLGGHSLLAIQVLSRTWATFQVQLTIRSLLEAPTVAGMADNIESVRVERNVPLPLLQPSSRNADLPLSFAQERLWFLDQLQPGSSVYNVATIIRLTGELDVEALERSLNEIVGRHEALRTTFSDREGQPFQIIAPTLSLALPVVSLQELPEAEREMEARRLEATETGRPFDLTQGPLLRCKLLRLDERQYVLIITQHHISTDGWSKTVLFRELAALYGAFSAGKSSPLPELPIQYADFAQWQREWLQGDGVESQLSYWKKQLNGAPPVLELPTDRTRPAFQTYLGERQSTLLSKTESETLRALGREEGVTLFMVLLAAFKVLLHRYTGQQDIVVGSPVAGRNRPEIESLIGFFLNTLVLRTDLSGDPSFRELLCRVREATLDAYDHQELPFEKLLEELQPPRDPSRTPLFQVFFNMHIFEGERLELSGLRAEHLSSPDLVSNFDLTFYVSEHDQQIRLDLVYNTDLFESARMAEMLGQIKHLLLLVAVAPGERISCYSLVTPPAGKRLPNPVEQLDSGWKGAVHTQFARQAQLAPEATAVVDSKENWTYRELNSRANQLANYLHASGIQPEDIVAIYGHRSASLVWAVLGILKAGAAFLILDPAYPERRLIDYLHMAKPRGFLHMEEAGAFPEALEEMVATSSACCHQEIPGRSAAAAVGLFEEFSKEDPGIVVGKDHLAYVSFTSGSSGRPKGVLGRHGPLSHFLPWQEETFALSAADRFSTLSGLSHDPLQRDIFTPLWVGATVCIPDPDTFGTSGLANWMAQEEITFCHLTPAMGHLLTEMAAPNSRIPSLRYAFFVGDKLTKSDVDRMRSLAPGVTCINSYGSTETQRAVGYYMVPTEPDKDRVQAVYPIGRGIDDVQLLVLNGQQQLAGVSELGEIHVRSPHLARGYLEDESSSRACFITNPFTGEADDRLYKTGDLGRYLPDGNVEFVGRADDQVKIRGFRVEPSEIEYALLQHPSVRETAVLTRKDAPHGPKLLAYFVSDQETMPSTRELREFLRELLPGYMVPDEFVSLDALPLTPNGKVDSRALPLPEWKSELEETFLAPRTHVEEALAAIWARVLGVQRISVHDNFFVLGGHSLLATQVISRVLSMFRVEIPLRKLFEAPTLADMALAITQMQLNKAEPEQVNLLLEKLEM